MKKTNEYNFTKINNNIVSRRSPDLRLLFYAETCISNIKKYRMEILSTLNHTHTLFLLFLSVLFLKRKIFYSTAAAGLCHAFETNIYACGRNQYIFGIICTVENISRKWIFLALQQIALLIAAVALAFIISKFLYQRRVFAQSVQIFAFCIKFRICRNCACSGIYGADSIELFDYLISTPLPLNIHMFTFTQSELWGLCHGSRRIFLKSLLNPIFVSLFIGAILGFLQIPRVWAL